jgi:glutaredoxin
MKREIILYSRNGCHLCEDAKDVLVLLQEEFEFHLQEIDIDQSDELTEKFGLYIPVIEVDGEIVQYGNIDHISLAADLNKKFTI